MELVGTHKTNFFLKVDVLTGKFRFVYRFSGENRKSFIALQGSFQPGYRLPFLTPSLPQVAGELEGSEFPEQSDGEDGEESYYHEDATVEKEGTFGEAAFLHDEMHHCCELGGGREGGGERKKIMNQN